MNHENWEMGLTQLVIVQNVIYEAIPLAILFLIQGCKTSNQGMLKIEN